MIEAGIYFALGLATAGLLAAAAAPILWRRAVIRTRIAAGPVPPAALAEIQADKDRLRAEFAMSTRRLEASVEKLRLKAGEHLAEIEDKHQLLRRLADEEAKRIEGIAALEAREREFNALLQQREARLSEASSDLTRLRGELADRGRTLEQLELALKAEADAAGEKTVELVAKGTEIDNLRQELSAARSRTTALTVERARLEADLSEARATWAAERQRGEGLAARIARLEEERPAVLAEAEARLAEADRRIREASTAGAAIASLQQQLAVADADRAAAQAHSAALVLRLEEASTRPTHDLVEEAVAGLERERDALQSQVYALREAYDQATAEIGALQRARGEEWDAERTENALLRERLNDIATEVARLARQYRGLGFAELAALAAGTPDIAPDQPAGAPTVADRIRALQRAARR